MKLHLLAGALGALMALLPATVGALPKPAPMFSDNMVLQQGQNLPVWGWAEDGEVVTVKFRRQTVKTTTQNLRWELNLHPLKPGGPDVFIISSRSGTIQFTNVMVGDVWVCSGQSNMEWPMSASYEPAADIASATNDQIRVFKVWKNRSGSPTTIINSAWELCSPKSIEGFSAVGYYFGRDLQKARKVPIGLIGTYWGGTPAEAWMSREALEINPRYRKEILDPFPAIHNEWRKVNEAYWKEKAEAEKAGAAFNKPPPWEPWGGFELYNGMIAPLLPYGVRGAIWYQGESNAGRAEQYRTLFPDMIRCWRRDWGQIELPFFCVQLAPFMDPKAEPADSAWAELREAQLLATQVLPKVGMAVITDVGDPKDIHPRKKQPVGERLSLAARAIAYGERITYSGPVYREQRINNDRIVLLFDHVGKGLEARGGELKGFAICGEDRKFVWAQAEIAGDRVVVRSEQVPKPVAVRYGWADFPEVNLWNKDGLPATPFRTDSFPLITAPK
jgi:sialate O-acetylesterase